MNKQKLIVNQTLPNRLVNLRLSNGYTQKTLAEELNKRMRKKGTLRPHVEYKIATISHYENGRKMPPRPTIESLSEILNCSIDYLLGGTDDRWGTSEPRSGSDQKFSYNADVLIPKSVLQKHDGNPVFVVFKQKAHPDSWGIVDAEKERIICKNMIIDYKNDKNQCEYYTFIPPENSQYFVGEKKRYGYSQMLKQDVVWIKSTSFDPVVKAKIDGIYKNNVKLGFFINNIGIVLPHEGYGISYFAYPLD